MLVREHQGLGSQLESLHRLPALAADGIGGEDPGVLHELGSGHALQDGIDLADVDWASERPPVAVGASGDGAEVLIKGFQRVGL